MPLPLSDDLRWRIVWLHHYKELDDKEIADLLDIHPSTIKRIVNQYNATGDVSPAIYQHGPKKMLGEPEELCIVESLLANPGIYLNELQQELFRSTGTSVSISTIFRTIRWLGFTRKKLRHVAMQPSDVKRAEFMEEMSYISADMIVWLDETGSDRRNERRKFGYHLRGMTPTDYKLTIRGMGNVYHLLVSCPQEDWRMLIHMKGISMVTFSVTLLTGVWYLSCSPLMVQTLDLWW